VAIPCKKGIDMEGKEGRLIAIKHLLSNGTTDSRAIAAEIEANFVGYQSSQDVYGVVSSFNKDPDNFCFGCFENKEPIWGKW
jgi:glutamine phosphoribosylpyrophosphate amidotransferase